MKPLHLNPDWLRQKYLVESLSTYDIGKIVHRDPKRVYEKLKDFGIPTRPRGQNLRETDDNYMRRPGVTNPFAGRSHSAATRRILSEKASRPKPYLRGSRNGMFGRNGERSPRWRGGIAPERQAAYSRADGRAFLAAVLERDDRTCARCGRKPTLPRGIHVHHLADWNEHPLVRLDPDYAICLCSPCHGFVRSRANVNREFIL